MLSPYLNFDSNCEEAFKHYEMVLGAKPGMIMRNKDAPPDMPILPGRDQKIMHAQISINGQILMGSDAPPDRYQKPQGMWVSLTIADPTEAERKFTALLNGGNIMMPFSKTFFAKGFGMGVDRFGIPWMINCPAEGM